MTLEEGDVILTGPLFNLGTPEGVGPVTANQVLVGTLSDQNQLISRIEFKVKNRTE